MSRMKTSEAEKRAGGTKALAAILGVTDKAVYAWGEQIPPLRLYQLKEKRPHWFRKARK